jgi:hypothetical protein
VAAQEVPGNIRREIGGTVYLLLLLLHACHASRESLFPGAPTMSRSGATGVNPTVYSTQIANSTYYE